jgi:peptide chain release factor 1
MPISEMPRERTVVASRWANGRRGRRVGQVVGRHVDGLHGRDRALVRRGDALLQLAHVGGERRLITDGRRDAAEERRDLRARLREAEDVVDEEQHVLPFLVPEVLGAVSAESATRARAPGGSFIWP